MEFWTESPHIDENFANEVRALLNELYPSETRVSKFEPPFDMAANKRLIEWQHERLGGVSAAQLAGFRREMEAAGLQSRLTTSNMVARTIEAVGTSEQVGLYVTPLDNGDARCSLGYTEPDSGSDVAAAKTRAIREGDDWVINGHKMFTSHAATSTHVFLLTRTDPDVPKHRGLTMFVVPLDSPGVEIRPVHTIGYRTTYMTYYTDVRVPDIARVGAVNDGWKVLRVALDLEHGAGSGRLRQDGPRSELTPSPPDAGTRLGPRLGEGGRDVGRLLSRTISWASQQSPHGRRPIDDPLVRTRLARLVIEDEIGRLLARRNDSDRALPGVGNGAKLWWTELYVRAAQECVDIMGAEGVVSHTEPDVAAEGWAEYAVRELAPITTIVGGVSEIHRDVIAERRLGLPRAWIGRGGRAS